MWGRGEGRDHLRDQAEKGSGGGGGLYLGLRSLSGASDNLEVFGGRERGREEAVLHWRAFLPSRAVTCWAAKNK